MLFVDRLANGERLAAQARALRTAAEEARAARGRAEQTRARLPLALRSPRTAAASRIAGVVLVLGAVGYLAANLAGESPAPPQPAKVEAAAAPAPREAGPITEELKLEKSLDLNRKGGVARLSLPGPAPSK